MLIHVAPYIQELIAQYLLDVHVPIRTPADPPTIDEFKRMQQLPYGALVGSSRFIAVVACPDIARFVNTLKQAQANPSRLYLDAAI